ncbi:MAG: hypothetical protein KDC98_05365, partial [Planctomycetes bacterium]|nr:hypothetical protein [Planctomycetota bacterium]
GAPWNTEFGASLRAIGDLDGDNIKELVIGSPGVSSNAGMVSVYSIGRNHLLGALSGEAANDRFGQCLSTLPDITGDGVEEIIVGAPGAAPGGRASAGRTTIHSFDPHLPGLRNHFGSGCTPAPFSGPEPRLATSLGQPRIGQNWRFGVSRATPGRLVICGLDLLPRANPLNLCALTPLLCGCNLYVNGSVLGTISIGSHTTSQANGMGMGQYTTTIPNLPWLVGLPIYGQCYVLDPGVPGPMTEALEVIIQ